MPDSSDVHEADELLAEPSANDVGDPGGRRPRPALLPFTLGILMLAWNGYLLVQFPANLFAPNLQGAVSLSLIFGSILMCLFLVAYAFGIGHAPRTAAPSITGFGAPLILTLLALAATIGAIESNRSTAERQIPNPCIEVYGQAQNIAKDNPKFRMPAKDRDEIRCAINSVIGR